MPQKKKGWGQLLSLGKKLAPSINAAGQILQCQLKIDVTLTYQI